MLPYADPRFEAVHTAAIPEQFGVLNYCFEFWRHVASDDREPDAVRTMMRDQAASALAHAPCALELGQQRAIEAAVSRLASYRRLAQAANPAMAIDHAELASDMAGQLLAVLSVLALKNKDVETAMARHDLAVLGAAAATEGAEA